MGGVPDELKNATLDETRLAAYQRIVDALEQIKAGPPKPPPLTRRQKARKLLVATLSEAGAVAIIAAIIWAFLRFAHNHDPRIPDLGYWATTFTTLAIRTALPKACR